MFKRSQFGSKFLSDLAKRVVEAPLAFPWMRQWMMRFFLTFKCLLHYCVLLILMKNAYVQRKVMTV